MIPSHQFAMSSSNREIVPYGSQRRNQDQPQNIRNFSIISWGRSSEDDAGYINLASEVAKSCERIILDARPDAFHTLRVVVQISSIVAVIAIVGYCIVQIVPHLVFLLSRILVDLPLGILTALCGLVAPLLDLLLVQLPLAIGRGVLSLLSGVLWVVTSLLSGIGWVLSGILYVIVLLLSGVGWVFLTLLYMITSLLSGVVWVISSVLYGIKSCVALPHGLRQ